MSEDDEKERCLPCARDQELGKSDFTCPDHPRRPTTMPEHYNEEPAVVLTDELRAELVTMLSEMTTLALTRTKAGRTSMPIYVEDALVLITLACEATGISGTELVEELDK